MNPRVEEEAWIKALDAFINSDSFRCYAAGESLFRQNLFSSEEYKEYIKAFNEYDTRDVRDRDNELEQSPSYIKWMYDKYKEPMQMLGILTQVE